MTQCEQKASRPWEMGGWPSQRVTSLGPISRPCSWPVTIESASFMRSERGGRGSRYSLACSRSTNAHRILHALGERLEDPLEGRSG
jgi:hypothetical protein